VKEWPLSSKSAHRSGRIAEHGRDAPLSVRKNFANRVKKLPPNPIQAIRARLSVPVFAAPMFLLSGPESVIAACAAGVLGGIPTLNARDLETLDSWMAKINSGLEQAERERPGSVAPWVANLIAHRSNTRVPAELELILRHRPPIVLVAWAKPGPIVDAIHGYGGVVFADVTTVEYARKAVDAGVDGLLLICAGAGGHTGNLSPFSFVPAVREFFGGTILLGGGIVDGRGIRAAEVLGADLAVMGTRFIATTECLASAEYKQMLIESTTRDVVKSAYFTGVPANYLLPSVIRAGIDPAVLEETTTAVSVQTAEDAKAWKDIWSGGHGVFATRQVMSTAELVQQLKKEYRQACSPD